MGSISAGSIQPPFYTLGSVSGSATNPIPFPNAYLLISSPRFTIGRIDVVQYKPNSHYEMQYHFTVQRQVAQGQPSRSDNAAFICSAQPTEI